MSSANSVHYAIRPNKAVERKIIFHVIDMMRDIFNFSTYRYVGFGAISFVDFIYAHKHLRISKLISIEENENTYKRALANKPYACIDVLYGDSSSVLPRIGVADFKTIYWLDYDSGPVGPVIDDAKWVLQRAPEGTILILTVNAHSGSLIPRNTPREKAIEEKIKSFRSIFGDAAPVDIKNKDVQDEKLRYVTMLSSVILDTLSETARKHGRSERVQTIFNINYNDGAPMLTVGVMLLNEDNVQAVVGVRDEISTMVCDSAPYVLQIPPLTHREKNSIDRLLPDAVGPAQNSLEQAGVHISEAQMSAYKKLYKFYPTFSEVIF